MSRPTQAARHAGQALRSFYSQRVGWVALLLTSTVMAYAGGAVMFWFHALYRGERGPAINPWFHWLLDSSLGFIGLTPALFLILPAALWILRRADRASSGVRVASYLAVVGVLFAAVTGPGPLLHDLVVGHGTVIARWAQGFFGYDPAVAARHAAEHPLWAESLYQVSLGVPVYIALASLGLAVIRLVARRPTLPRAVGRRQWGMA